MDDDCHFIHVSPGISAFLPDFKEHAKGQADLERTYDGRALSGHLCCLYGDHLYRKFHWPDSYVVCGESVRNTDLQ